MVPLFAPGWRPHSRLLRPPSTTDRERGDRRAHPRTIGSVAPQEVGPATGIQGSVPPGPGSKPVPRPCARGVGTRPTFPSVPGSASSRIPRVPGAMLCASVLQCTAYPEGPSDMRSGVPDFDSCRESALPRAAPCLVTSLDRAPKSSRPQVGPCSSGYQCGVLASPRPRRRTACRPFSLKRASSSRR